MIKLKENTLWHLVLFAGVFWFCACFFYRLDRLGVNIDESANALWVLNTWDVLCAEGFFAAVSKTTLLMCDFYVGSLKHLFLGPFIIIGGCSILASRLAFFPVALGFIILTFFFVRRWFGLGVGALTTFFLCINPVFIRSSRTSFRREEIFIIALFLAGLLLVDSFALKKSSWKLALAGFLFGLALWAKLMFVAYGVGLVVAVIFMGRGFRKKVLNEFLSTREFLFGFCPMFLLGTLPLIFYNAINSWRTLREGLKRLVSPDLNCFGATNLDVVFNLWQRCLHLYSFLCRRLHHLDNIEIPVLNHLNVYFFFLSLVAVLSVVVFRSDLSRSWSRKFRFLFVVYLVVFVLSVITPRGILAGHITLLFPFCEIVCALFLLKICVPLLKPARLERIVPVCFILVLFCFEFLSLRQIYNVKGNSFFSAVPQQVVDFLKADEGKTAVMPYFFCQNVLFLSARTLDARPDGRNIETYYSSAPYSRDEYENIRQLEEFYLVTEFSETIPSYDKSLLRVLCEDGRKVREVKRFEAELVDDFTYVISFVSSRA